MGKLTKKEFKWGTFVEPGKGAKKSDLPMATINKQHCLILSRVAAEHLGLVSTTAAEAKADVLGNVMLGYSVDGDAIVVRAATGKETGREYKNKIKIKQLLTEASMDPDGAIGKKSI